MSAELRGQALARALRVKAETGRAGGADVRPLAEGAGWSAFDIVCTSGPRDRPFEERHSEMTISLVLAGSFTYRGDYGRSVLTSGALLLGHMGRSYECGHEHGEGDRCLSFHYQPQLFECAAAETGGLSFRRSSLGPGARLSRLAAQATLALFEKSDFEEVALNLAVEVMRICNDAPPPRPTRPKDEKKVVDAVRLLETRLDQPLAIAAIADAVGVSPFRFLHLFKAVTGTSPHQYRLRLRLQEAARRLRSTDDSVTQIGLASGFDDLSNFIRTFRREFGVSPTTYRNFA